MTSDIVMTSILSSTLAVTVVSSIKELVLWKMNRKAKLEDEKKEDRLKDIEDLLSENKLSIQRVEELVTQLESKLQIALYSDRVVLKDRIKFIALSYLKRGYISMEDKHNLNEMWHIYHFDLGGNGDLDDIMHMVEDLPLKELQ